uniref:Calponin-homology (CH) domain-containing protein n=1 Tax=Rodentolepis nana TaxID=102285 RepID=A0A0R3TL88_RODNA
LTQVPPSMPPSLTSLELGQNKILILPPGWIQSCTRLQELNISNNQLEDLGVTTEPALLSLTLLNLHKNHLRDIPKLAVFPKLIDLYLGDNRIETFCLEKFDGLKSLSTLELSRNRISSVPDNIPNTLPKLCRLNLSNNDIKYVPTDLGLMESLEVLQLSANPLRSIPQDVLSSGSRALKELLRDRHEPIKKPDSLQSSIKEETKAVAEPLQSSPYDYLSVLNTNTGVLNWGQDKKQATGNKFPRGFTTDPADQTLPPLDDEDTWKSVALKGCKPDALVRTVILSSRQLNQFPLGVLAFRSSLAELNLSRNKLAKLPEEIGLLSKLENLDVSFNALTALPEALSNLSCLATLKIDFNPGLGPELPYSILFEEPLKRSLREISASGCRLTRLPPAELISKDRMPQLTSFDVSDNNIDALQPELGLCTQIQNLHLSGNSFRIPRPNIVCKGTAAVLEYLRLRIAQ